MKVASLGHVVLRVADRERAERFYAEVLGLPICARLEMEGVRMTFFTLGNHHDFAVAEVPGVDPTPEGAVGLDHVAFKIGNGLDELREAKAHLEAAGITLRPIDHEVSKSLYFEDPDGNGVEVYVDVSDIWKTDPQRVAQATPMTL